VRQHANITTRKSGWPRQQPSGKRQQPGRTGLKPGWCGNAVVDHELKHNGQLDYRHRNERHNNFAVSANRSFAHTGNTAEHDNKPNYHNDAGQHDYSAVQRDSASTVRKTRKSEWAAAERSRFLLVR